MNIFKAPRKVKEVADEQVVSRLSSTRKNAFQRFPLLFTLLSAFGVVATTVGLERLIDRLNFFNRNPYFVLLAGLLTLLVTGTLYKKL
jgi:hypothetical protein